MPTPAVVNALGELLRRALWLGDGPPPERADPVPVETAALEAVGLEAGELAADPIAPELEPVEPELVSVVPVAAPAAVLTEVEPVAVIEPEPAPVEVVASEPITATTVPLPIEPIAATTVPPRPIEPIAATTASPPPPPPVVPPTPTVPMTMSGDEVTVTLGDRHYRIRNLGRAGVDALKVTLRVTCGESFYLDTIDLYHARSRVAFVAAAAEEIAVQPEVVKKDLGTLLLTLEELVAARVRAVNERPDPVASMAPADRAAAEVLLRDPQLMVRAVADLERCGLIGEPANKLMALVALVSRKLRSPLAILIQSVSGAGKSSLMDGVLAFLPAEEVVKYSAMTGQSLYYVGESDLRHKVLALVEEEGSRRVAYTLKLLQSEGELTIASTGKDQKSGRMVAHSYRVAGPVMLIMTTTAIDIDPELHNRCIVLAIEETREQTRRVHALQRLGRTLDGILASTGREAIIRLHQNAQRLLRPLVVVNPYAHRLRFPDHQTRMRRDHAKYLSLVEAVALWHQYQRPLLIAERDGRSIPYIEATLADVAVANRLAHHVLGRTLDELAPQTRTLLGLVVELIAAACAAKRIDRADYRFTRRDVREATRWGLTQLKVHLRRLEELELLIVHRGGRGQQRVYELAYQGEGTDGQAFVPGLIDVAELARELGLPEPVIVWPEERYDGDRAGVNGQWSGGGRGDVGGVSGGGRDAESRETAVIPVPPTPRAAKPAKPRKGTLAAHRRATYEGGVVPPAAAPPSAAR